MITILAHVVAVFHAVKKETSIKLHLNNTFIIHISMF